jgi:hypothetical protein
MFGGIIRNPFSLCAQALQSCLGKFVGQREATGGSIWLYWDANDLDKYCTAIMNSTTYKRGSADEKVEYYVLSSGSESSTSSSSSGSESGTSSSSSGDRSLSRTRWK